MFLFNEEPDNVSCLYALALKGSTLGDVLPMIIELLALGAIAMTWENLRPVPTASGASPRSLPSSILAASSFVLIFLKIFMLADFASADSNAMFFF